MILQKPVLLTAVRQPRPPSANFFALPFPLPIFQPSRVHHISFVYPSLYNPTRKYAPLLCSVASVYNANAAASSADHKTGSKPYQTSISLRNGPWSGNTNDNISITVSVSSFNVCGQNGKAGASRCAKCH